MTVIGTEACAPEGAAGRRGAERGPGGCRRLLGSGGGPAFKPAVSGLVWAPAGPRRAAPMLCTGAKRCFVCAQLARTLNPLTSSSPGPLAIGPATPDPHSLCAAAGGGAEHRPLPNRPRLPPPTRRRPPRRDRAARAPAAPPALVACATGPTSRRTVNRGGEEELRPASCARRQRPPPRRSIRSTRG